MEENFKLPVACLAPVLTDEKLAHYEQLIAAAQVDDECRECLDCCLQCVKAWWELPESTLEARKWDVSVPTGEKGSKGEPLRTPGVLTDVPFSPDLVDALFDVTPWPRELASMTPVFDKLSGELRDCAYHLLWYANEIARDREPITQDKLSNVHS